MNYWISVVFGTFFSISKNYQTIMGFAMGKVEGAEFVKLSSLILNHYWNRAETEISGAKLSLEMTAPGLEPGTHLLKVVD